jgi:hypothetical protein
MRRSDCAKLTLGLSKNEHASPAFEHHRANGAHEAERRQAVIRIYGSIPRRSIFRQVRAKERAS